MRSHKNDSVITENSEKNALQALNVSANYPRTSGMLATITFAQRKAHRIINSFRVIKWLSRCNRSHIAPFMLVKLEWAQATALIFCAPSHRLAGLASQPQSLKSKTV